MKCPNQEAVKLPLVHLPADIPTTAIAQELQIQLPEDFSNEQIEINVTATATEPS
ncbi:hypothetical protein OH492_17750 [Vibrio chagasii]|nr:hypothetical protein [Vibrio chagasii]